MCCLVFFRDWLCVSGALSHFIESTPPVPSPWIRRVCQLHLTDCRLIARSIVTCPLLPRSPFPRSLLSSPPFAPV